VKRTGGSTSTFISASSRHECLNTLSVVVFHAIDKKVCGGEPATLFD
jgi:hypothetical protein